LDSSSFPEEKEGEAFTVAATLSALRDNANLSSLNDNAICLKRTEVPLASYSKYRTFEGYGNNLRHPHWGAAFTPYGRFAEKKYSDGINCIPDLPNPRFIVDNLLKKVAIRKRTENIPNMMFSCLFSIFVLDSGRSSSSQTFDKKPIQCCTADKKEVPEPFKHSTCLSYPIADDDYFHKQFGVKCMSHTRSDRGSHPNKVQFGEVRNHASSFADLSLIYGEKAEHNKEIRTYSMGQLRLSPGNTYPVNSKGAPAEITFRLSISVSLTFWSNILLRNHNLVAKNLAALNPSWDDETIFQEARRINIAIYQNLVTSKEFVQLVIGDVRVGSYNPTIDPSCTVEFFQTSAKFSHYFSQEKMLFVRPNGSEEIMLSDVTWKTELVDVAPDDGLRGALEQRINLEMLTDEVET
jgi:hypothetical protein